MGLQIGDIDYSPNGLNRLGWMTYRQNQFTRVFHYTSGVDIERLSILLYLEYRSNRSILFNLVSSFPFGIKRRSVDRSSVNHHFEGISSNRYRCCFICRNLF